MLAVVIGAVWGQGLQMCAQKSGGEHVVIARFEAEQWRSDGVCGGEG